MGRHKKYDEQLAVDKGVKLFRESGYHNTSAADIVNALDIPKGTFFGMFNTKEEYVLKVLQKYIVDTLAFMDKTLYENTKISAAKRLKLFYASLSNYFSNEGCAYGCLLNTLTSEIGGYNDTFSRLIKKGHSQFIDKLEPCVKEAQEANDFRSDINSRELTYFIHTSFDGALIKMKGVRNDEALQIFLNTTFKLIEM
ncbi:TetR/AcrR family transcriptional regulator [Aquimarina sp. 2304DJ70-9]|uniref:TetR/AcrR family transcriptional regulator n=1 Tax=Aquimarina penaris TaxID=3231044 RepID=UPI003463624D